MVKNTLILLLALMAMTLTACEKNTPLIYTYEGGRAEVLIHFEDLESGERAGPSGYTINFTLFVVGSEETFTREIGVIAGHAQGYLELPANTELTLEARAIHHGFHTSGEITTPFSIGEGEVQALELFMFYDEF